MSHEIEERVIATLQNAIKALRDQDVPGAILYMQDARDTALKLNDHEKMLSKLPNLRSKLCPSKT